MRGGSLPKGYWIAHIDVSDAVFREYGSRFLVRSGASEITEGRLRAHHVVTEFRDYATAVACYRSPEYQKLVALREPHATADVLIIEGYDGPRP